jgi:hypothetical protein
VAAATGEIRRERRAVVALSRGDAEKAVSLLEPMNPEGSGAFVLGTALLQAGRAEQAIEPLTRALAGARGPEERRRALHNLSVAQLHLAAQGRGAREVHARAAAAAASDALRLLPGDAGTRWNLALAQRLMAAGMNRQEPAGRDGSVAVSVGGGAARGSVGGGLPSLSPEEATSILDALRSEEGPSVARGASKLFGYDPTSPVRRGPPW